MFEFLFLLFYYFLNKKYYEIIVQNKDKENFEKKRCI
jgi:hypothetical protein